MEWIFEGQVDQEKPSFDLAPELGNRAPPGVEEVDTRRRAVLSSLFSVSGDLPHVGLVTSGQLDPLSAISPC